MTSKDQNLINIEEKFPEDHFLRVIKKYFDRNFIYDEVKNYIPNLVEKV